MSRCSLSRRSNAWLRNELLPTSPHLNRRASRPRPGRKAIQARSTTLPNTPNIQLDIRLGGSSDPGRVDVPASNGQVHGYLYTGGDDEHGGLIQTVDQGRDTAPIQLTADQRYHISGHSFPNDTRNQLSWIGNGNRAGVIVDANNQVETVEYSILVTDTGNGNCTIACDPPVINR